jgi:cytidine deaminase
MQAEACKGNTRMSQELFEAAKDVRRQAYAPYSGFQVGAALRAADGQIYVGCNVENVAYPEGCCSEAGAISAMVAGGQRKIQEILVSPCGGCRQKLAEFGDPGMTVFLADLTGVQAQWRLADLLPATFGKDHLRSGG